MHRGAASFLALSFATMALAGCLAPATEPLASPAGDTEAGPWLGAASHLPASFARAASVDAPPQWAVGEWWTYSVESLLFPGHTLNLTRVVAGDEPGRYLVGMPADDYVDEVFVDHFPGMGQIDRATLGFEAHDLMFEPLRFPLAEGANWTTHWYSGAPMNASVTSVANGTAEIHLDHPTRATDLVYDAALGEIASMEIQGYLRYEVTGHGFGYQGKVVVPYNVDLVVCHGRALVVEAIDDCALDIAPRLPVETVPIHGDYTRLSFGLILRPGPVPVVAAMVPSPLLSIEVTAPGGSTYAASAPLAAENTLVAYGEDEPVGAWQMRALAIGTGSVLFEGAAYRALEVELA
ncbi:MAG TPA: hypothetical protein VGR28_14520 [Candidatus Thermoplasmatota archaeon]|jgi:hypothetical protein|nr:hypothetical protein [Candidatus Thermoplasmatota archaeon]